MYPFYIFSFCGTLSITQMENCLEEAVTQWLKRNYQVILVILCGFNTVILPSRCVTDLFQPVTGTLYEALVRISLDPRSQILALFLFIESQERPSESLRQSVLKDDILKENAFNLWM